MIPRKHGGLAALELRTLGIDPTEVLDFSVNCNPYGPCQAVVDAVRAAPIDRYPDPSALRAREALAASLDVDVAEVALGNGACELLWSLAQALVRPATKALIVEPTFCEFRAAVERLGGRAYEWRATAERDFEIDLEMIARAARSREATLIYLCAPNSPTGVAVPALRVAELAAANPGTSIVLDQSFLTLSQRHQELRVRLPPNVVCVRSMTKDHAIAGLRVGYVVAAPALVERLEESRPSWTTSALAQTAAIAACAAGEFVERSRRLLHADQAHLVDDLRTLGLAPIPSSTCFSIVRVGGAAALRQRLLSKHRILVRDCASFGLPEYIRIAARPAAERLQLLAALRQELG